MSMEDRMYLGVLGRFTSAEDSLRWSGALQAAVNEFVQSSGRSAVLAEHKHRYQDRVTSVPLIAVCADAGPVPGDRGELSTLWYLCSNEREPDRAFLRQLAKHVQGSFPFLQVTSPC